MQESTVLVLTNSKGRILLTATRYYWNGSPSFRYEGPGIGGGGLTHTMLMRSAAFVKCDSKSARASGELATEFDAYYKSMQF